MFRPGKNADKTLEHQLKTTLCLLRLKLRDGGWLSDDEPELGHEVDHQPCVRPERLAKGVTPAGKLCLALAEKRSHEVLKSLGERRIRDVALVLVELACGEESARRHQ